MRTPYMPASALLAVALSFEPAYAESLKRDVLGFALGSTIVDASVAGCQPRSKISPGHDAQNTTLDCQVDNGNVQVTFLEPNFRGPIQSISYVFCSTETERAVFASVSQAYSVSILPYENESEYRHSDKVDVELRREDAMVHPARFLFCNHARSYELKLFDGAIRRAAPPPPTTVATPKF